MKNQIKTILLLGVLSAMLIGIGALIGQGAMVLFTFLALALNLGAYFFSDRVVMKLSGAKEVTPMEAPGLHRIVEELAVGAGIPKPKVCIIPEAHANAFATGRNPQRGVVAVTEGILRLLTERELRGVLAHEMAHIRNRDILVASVAAAVSTAVGYIANALSFTAMFGGGGGRDGEERGSGAGGLVLALVAPIAAMLVQMGISRSREYLADETGARICGDPEALASALEKLSRAAERVPGEVEPATASLYIVNPLAGGEAIMGLFSTHPPMRDRIRRLREMAYGPRISAA